MAEERAAAAEDEGDHLPRGVRAVDEREREQRAAERTDDAVDRVPRGVDPRDLVGEEFGERADARDAEYPRVREDLQRLQMFGQRQPAEVHRDPGRENGEVKAPAREQAKAAGDAQNFQYSHGPAPTSAVTDATYLARAGPRGNGLPLSLDDIGRRMTRASDAFIDPA